MNADQEKPKLNLYVVGDSRGNPEVWSPYGNRVYVFAESPEQALEMTDRPPGGAVGLVEAESPCILAEECYSGG